MITPTFKEIPFGSFHNTSLGQELWLFLLEPLSFRSLVVATHLNKPAVSGVSDLLLERFGSKGSTPRSALETGFNTYATGYDLNYVKRYLGVSVKIILEANGFEILRRNCLSGDPLQIFNKATKYQKK